MEPNHKYQMVQLKTQTRKAKLPYQDVMMSMSLEKLAREISYTFAKVNIYQILPSNPKTQIQKHQIQKMPETQNLSPIQKSIVQNPKIDPDSESVIPKTDPIQKIDSNSKFLSQKLIRTQKSLNPTLNPKTDPKSKNYTQTRQSSSILKFHFFSLRT